MSSATVGVKMSEKPNSARAVPVRVKKKTLKKLSNSERLEIENAKMEERLRQLRSTIEQEKKQRDSQPQTGYLWKSGKEGAVTTHAKEHMNKNKINHARLAEKKIKVKFLTPETEKPKPKRVPRVSTPHNSSTTDGQSWAEPQHNLPRDPEPVAPLEQVNHTTFEQLDNFPFLERQTSIVGPVCGQCELNGAKLNCLECGEKYCGACFASFHKRGALKTHTSRPLTRQVGPRASKQEAPLRQAGDLWGEYDESSAAQSFQEALQAWRGDSTPGTPKQQNSSTGITADGSHGTQQKLTEINFSDNQNVSYFERIMLKKSKDAVTIQEDTGRLSRENSQEITVSQLDFCRDLLEQNIIEDREDRRELDRPESVIEIVEVNGDIGYLEEESGCEVSEAKCSATDSEEEEDFEIARRLLNSVKIEEYSPTRIHESRPTTAESNSVRQSASDCTKSLHFRSEISDLVVEEVQSQVKPGRVSSAAGPNKPQRPATPPPRVQPQTVQPVRNSSGPADVITSAPRFQVENPRSPLLRRMPTNPEISTRNSVGSVKSDVSSKRPLTADVTILSSQAWKTSFVGFLKAGLPGHSPAEPVDPTNKEEEKETGILLRGPPSWCPGESQAHNENFQSRENTISFSVSGAPQPEKGTGRKSDISPRPTKSREGPTRSGRRDPPVCQDLDKLDDLEDDSEDVLENLGSELHLQASKSRDLGDYITNLRRATPEALSLLTHDDRMNQLDMESRGISPSATPLLMPRITTRESLFLDFEDVEKQIMAGEDVDGMQ